MSLYRLARQLHVDIDDVRRWSYVKINGWVTYFAAEERLEKDGPRS